MFRSPLGRKPALRALRARRLVLVVSLFAVAASLPFIPHGAAGRQEEAQSRPRSQAAVKGQANIIDGAEFAPGEVLVRFRTDAAAKSAEAAPASLQRAEDGGEVTFRRFEGSDIVRGLRLATVDPARTLEAVAELASRPDVLYAEPNYIWRAAQFVPPPPNDPRYTSGEMYGMGKINAPGAWNAGATGSKSVVVGVLDGGVDINHPDLKENIWTNSAEANGIPGVDDDGNGLVDDVNGWDFEHGDKTIFDNEKGDDHATHVAGTIGAKGNNGTGVTGVNWDVSIMALKVLGPSGGATSTIIKGYNYARQMRQRGVNLRVLNNSYGGPGKSLAALDAIQQLNAAGILFVVAAGNGGGDHQGDDNFTFPDYPASYDVPNVIAVAATDQFDSLASFSNFSSRLVSVGAPGVTIMSTTPNGGYEATDWSGTSMASPHVAGAAALVCAAKPDITLAQLRGVIAYTGDRVNALDGTTTTGRRLNVTNALHSALENDTTAPAPVGNLRVIAPLAIGRNVALAWTASGEDGNSGVASDYDFFYVNPTTGAKTLLPTNLVPAAPGTQQSVVVTMPYRNFNGTILLRAYDNVGNSADTSVAVAIPDNYRTNPYVVTLGGAPGLTPMTGTPLMTGDDKYTSYPLPFAFKFYGEGGIPTISTNGAIYFSNPPRRGGGDADDSSSALDGLQGQKMIAGLWDDIDINPTRRADSGVYVRESDANHIIFRWQGVPCNPTQASDGACTGGNPINFEIELRADGTIQMRYGEVASMFPVVGISNGDPEPYVITSHTSKTPSKNLTNAQTVTFTPRPQSLTITGQLTEGGAGLSGVTMTLTGTHSATTTTDAAGQYFFANLNIGATYTVTPSKPGYVFTPSRQFFGLNGLESLTANFSGAIVVSGPNSLGFAQANYQYGEADGRATFTVTRTGDTSGAATVDYRTVDSDTFSFGCADTVNNQGGAFARCDFGVTVGKLSFAADETSKTITVPIIEDGHDENAETFQLQLSNAAGSGTSLGAQSTATVTILDNDTGVVPNPIANSIPFFVRQQYLDFLSREPEASEPWSGVMTRCANIFTGPAVNTDCDRIAVSRAFFESPEFNLKGFYVFRFYKLAFNRLPEYAEIVTDMSFVAGATAEEVFARKAQLATVFTAREKFVNAYGGMNNSQYVVALMGRYGLSSVTTPDPLTPDSGTRASLSTNDLFNRLQSGALTRAQVFRAIADSDEVQALEFNSAFIAVQYYGYLRRTPEDSGYQANLNALLRGTSRREMINGFLNSTEYRLRFGQP